MSERARESVCEKEREREREKERARERQRERKRKKDRERERYREILGKCHIDFKSHMICICTYK